MLQVTMLRPFSFISKDKPYKELLQENPSFILSIRAPIFWWMDFDYTKVGFNLEDFSEEERREMPVSTIIEGSTILEYHEIVGLCDDYINGTYKYEGSWYQWSNEREWNDLCETLLDIRGVRELVSGGE